MKRAAFVAFILGATAAFAAAPVAARGTCGAWKGNPRTAEATVVAFDAFGEFGVDDEFKIVVNVNNRLDKDIIRARLISDRLDSYSDKRIPVAMRVVRHTVLRLPIGAAIFDVDLGRAIPEIAEFRVLTDLAGLAFRNAPPPWDGKLTCLEKPGLFELAEVDGPPRKPRGGEAEERDLSELGRGGAKPPSLSALGTDTDGARPPEPERSITELVPPAVTLPAPVEPPPPVPAPPPVPTTVPAPVTNPRPAPRRTGGVTEARVCDLDSDRIYAVDPVLLAVDPVTAGRRNTATEAPWVMFNEAANLVTETGEALRLTTRPGDLEPLQVLRSVQGALGVDQLVSPLHPDAIAPVNAPVAGSTDLRVIVLGDAQMVAVSGLAVLDADLAAAAPGLTVVWHPVGRDGSLGAPEEFAGFGDLVARARDVGVSEVRYSSAAVMRRFAEEVAEILTTSPEQVDQVIWVLQGVLMPDETPRLLSDMIRQVNARGNIPRFEDGDRRPHKWLHVLAGAFAQSFSEGYVRGPVLRADPPIGEIEVERSDRRTPRSILGDPGRLALTLASAARRKGEGGARGDGRRVSDTPRVVQASAAYGSIGIIASADRLKEIYDSAALTALLIARMKDGSAAAPDRTPVLDLSALLLLRTTDLGAPVGLTLVTGGIAPRLARLREAGAIDPYAEFLQAILLRWATGNVRIAADDCNYTYLRLR